MNRPVLAALVVADDLTGAADTAVPFARRGARTLVSLSAPDGGTPTGVGTAGAGAVLAIDTDTRRAGPAEAARLVRRAVSTAPPAQLHLKKVDSTLRGNIGAEAAAVLGACSARLAVCAPAFPSTGRTTRDGVQWARGARVGAVADHFTGLHVAHVPLAAARGPELAELLVAHRDAGTEVVVVDAETDADLAALARAGAALSGDVLWVGSGGLGAALAGTCTGAGIPARPAPVTGPVLVVVGSGTPEAEAQAAALRTTGVREVRFGAGALLAGSPAALAPPAAAVAGALADGCDVLVTIAEGRLISPGEGRRAVAALAGALAPLLGAAPSSAADRPLPGALVVTGGETARTLLTAFGVEGVEVAGEVEPGVVRGRLVGGPGCPVVTKAGAFGDAGSLVRAVTALRASPEGSRAVPHGDLP